MDPPTRFDLAARRPLRDVPQILDGPVGWSMSPTGLVRHDLATGRTATMPSVTGPTGPAAVLGPPRLVGVGFGRRVLGAHAVTRAGHGLVPPLDGVDLVATSDAPTAPTDAVLPRMLVAQLPLPAWASTDPTLSIAVVAPPPAEWADLGSGAAQATASTNGTVVVTAAGRDGRISYGVDLDAGRPAWTAPNLLVGAVVGDRAVGVLSPAPPSGPLPGTAAQRQRVVGIALGTGRPVWTSPDDVDDARVAPAGPSLTSVAVTDHGNGSSFRLIDPRDGHTAAVLVAGRGPGPGSGPPDVACDDDQADDPAAGVTVCTGTVDGVRVVRGLEPGTGRALWRLPEVGRAAPVVTAVWHGRVYAQDVDGPVVLDVRTGHELPDRPQVAPRLVDAYGAVAGDPPAPASSVAPNHTGDGEPRSPFFCPAVG